MEIAKFLRFRSRCEDGITVDDIDTLVDLPFVELWSLANDLKIHINSYDVYQYLIKVLTKLDTLTLAFVLTYVDIRYAKEIIRQLDYIVITELMGNFKRELSYASLPVKVWLYVDLISICLNRLLVFHKMGFETSMDELFDVAILSNIKELNPWLYRNLNEVFNIDREILKRKLING